jgi:SNF2 family DNA or RNA helicase
MAMISSEELGDIEAVDTVAPMSSKSDMIVKHVKKSVLRLTSIPQAIAGSLADPISDYGHRIRRVDTLAKIVVFSAWNETLDVLQQAFHRNSIKYVKLEQGSGAAREGLVRSFIEDPTIAAFLLHTKSQSAGLNLTCAQYVFLVEPLLHPSLEIQAVARVHRIGQKHETNVFQYYVTDSVDERVAELRAVSGTRLQA